MCLVLWFWALGFISPCVTSHALNPIVNRTQAWDAVDVGMIDPSWKQGALRKGCQVWMSEVSDRD